MRLARRPLLFTLLFTAIGCTGSGLPTGGHSDLGTHGHQDMAQSGDAAAGCPGDIFDAVGKACSTEGKFCGGPCTDPCQFCNMIECSNGKWTQLEAAPDPNCGQDGGQDGSANACTTAGGQCVSGDFVPPQCPQGTHEDDNGAKATACGLGICCMPDQTDCRTQGCAPGSYCSACLTPSGSAYVCIGDGAAC